MKLWCLTVRVSDRPFSTGSRTPTNPTNAWPRSTNLVVRRDLENRWPSSRLAADLSPMARAEDIPIDGFVSLARALAVQHALRHDAGA